MGTFSTIARNEYDDPPVPAAFNVGRNTRKAFLRGFFMGILKDATAWKRYKTPGLQRAYGAGWTEAHRQRRERGETF